MSSGGGFVQRFIRNVRASDGAWMTYPRTVKFEELNRKRREYPDIEWAAEQCADPGRVRLNARRIHKPAPTSNGLVPHPMFIGLFEELPDPGTAFDAEAQARWLAAAAGVLKFVYPPNPDHSLREAYRTDRPHQPVSGGVEGTSASRKLFRRPGG
jgi:hypothetical protein